jgi:NTP pyrophosphatase (non-canonical NTP hydrolase)
MKIENFDVYQQESRKTWNEIPMNHSIVYPTMGMVNEAGEVAGKVKKIFRDRGGEITEADREALKQELGDVLWYMAQICTELNLSLQEVAESNLTKLFSRLERGQIKGDGDNR